MTTADEVSMSPVLTTPDSQTMTCSSGRAPVLEASAPASELEERARTPPAVVAASASPAAPARSRHRGDRIDRRAMARLPSQPGGAARLRFAARVRRKPAPWSPAEAEKGPVSPGSPPSLATSLRPADRRLPEH